MVDLSSKIIELSNNLNERNSLIEKQIIKIESSLKDLEFNNSQLKNKLNDFTKTKEILEKQLNELDTVKLQLECDLINKRQLLEN